MITVTNNENCRASARPPARASSEPTKYTAKDIEQNCPARLQQLGTEIAERLKRAEKQANIAADHVIAVDQLLAEAKKLCDGDAAFNKFREFCCPQLGKSQAYALLAIGAGKKTFAQHRTAERERKQKSRAHQRTAALNSGTVPEKSEPQEGPTDVGAVHAKSTRIGATLAPASPRSTVAPGDEALSAFTAQVLELDRRTAKRPPERFSETAVPVEVLARLGNLFIGIANIKKSEPAMTGQVTALPDNESVLVGHPTVTTLQAALQANSAEMVA